MSARAIRRVPAAVLLAAVAACGGGGGGGGADAPLLRTDIGEGDYLVYDMGVTPAGGSLVAYRIVATFHDVGASGSRRVQTASIGQPISYSTYNANAAVVSQDASLSGDVTCSYSPAMQSSPPFPRSVGQTWSVNTTRTCGQTVDQVEQAGRIDARETITVPAGTFDTFRAQRTAVFRTAAAVTQQTLTCWYALERGILVRCDYITTTNPGTPASTSDSTTQVLIGAGGTGHVPQGNVTARFGGSWHASYSGGGQSGTCGLIVAGDGGITGACQPAGGVSFQVAGSVAADGAVGIGLPGGGALVGTLAQPYSGGGTWTQAGASGTWTTAHN